MAVEALVIDDSPGKSAGRYIPSPKPPIVICCVGTLIPGGPTRSDCEAMRAIWMVPTAQRTPSSDSLTRSR